MSEELARERKRLSEINAELESLYQKRSNVSNIRENAIARLQKNLPHWSRKQLEIQVDKMITEVRADHEPTNENELKQMIKRKAGLK